jgi:cobalt-zinc-cadmium efflux system protein
VERALRAVLGVADVHDLRGRTLASGMDVAQAHLTLAGDASLALVLAGASAALHENVDIDRATLQVGPVGAGACPPSGW